MSAYLEKEQDSSQAGWEARSGSETPQLHYHMACSQRHLACWQCDLPSHAEARRDSPFVINQQKHGFHLMHRQLLEMSIPKVDCIVASVTYTTGNAKFHVFLSNY